MIIKSPSSTERARMKLTNVKIDIKSDERIRKDNESKASNEIKREAGQIGKLFPQTIRFERLIKQKETEQEKKG